MRGAERRNAETSERLEGAKPGIAVPQKTSQMESEARRDSSTAQADAFAGVIAVEKVFLLRAE